MKDATADSRFTLHVCAAILRVLMATVRNLKGCRSNACLDQMMCQMHLARFRAANVYASHTTGKLWKGEGAVWMGCNELGSGVEVVGWHKW